MFYFVSLLKYKRQMTGNKLCVNLLRCAACISHVYLCCLRRLTRFPPYCVTMRVFFTFLCTRVSSSFQTLCGFSSVWCHNACVFYVSLHSRFFIVSDALRVFIVALRVFLRIASKCVFLLAFQHRFRRFTRFPPYGLIMRVFHTFICIAQDALRVFLRMASQCVCFSRFSALAFLYRFRRLAGFPPYSVTMRVLYSHFCIVLDVLRVFLRMGS